MASKIPQLNTNKFYDKTKIAGMANIVYCYGQPVIEYDHIHKALFG